MEKTKLKIRKVKPQDDFTIIYKGKGGIVEIKTSKNDFLNALRYFSSKKHEIDLVDEYYIHDKFCTEVFKDFIESIISQEANINEDNFSEYYELSCKYQYHELQERIEEFIKERPDLLHIINQLIDIHNDDNNDNQSFNTKKEELIAQYLDIVLRNGYLDKIPIHIVFRIINSPKRKLVDHHLLFNFVTERIRQAQQHKTPDGIEDDLKMLTSSLDFCEMSENEIEELLTLQEKFQCFQPRHSSDRMKIFLNESKEIRNKISKLEEIVSQILLKENENEKSISSLKEQTNKSLQTIEKKVDQNLITEKDELTKVGDKIKSIEKRLDKIEPKQKLIDDQIDKQKLLIQKNQEMIESVKAKSDEEGRKSSESRLELQKVKETQTNQGNSIRDLEKNVTNIQQDLIQRSRDRDCSQGFFNMLFLEANGNPADKGLVQISGNSDNSHEQALLRNIIDSNWSGTHWVSKDEPNSFIKIEFKNAVVKIGSYRIRVGYSDGDCYFTSWVLEGITQDNKKIILSEVNNSNQIKPPQSETTVAISSGSFVRAVVLTMKGKNSNGSSYMRFRNIELFGIFCHV